MEKDTKACENTEWVSIRSSAICGCRKKQSTAQTAVMKLCTNDVEMFLHFHEFLQADSGMGSLPNPAFTSLKTATELPVVKITEPSSMAEMLVDGSAG